MAPALAYKLLLGQAALVVALSLVTLCAYALDKRRAKKGRRRISEQTLHRLAWLGGAPGGWLGRQWFRHKTLKRGFTVRLALATAVHLAVAAGLAWLWLQP